MHSPADTSHRLPSLPHLSIVIAAAFLLLMPGTAHASSRSSASYTITTDITDAGGQRGTSGAYTIDGGMGAIGGHASAPATTENGGYVGQLYDPTSLTLTATPDFVVEGLSTQLTAIATMDDGSLINLGGSDPRWSVLGGAIAGISTSGVLTGGEVFINAPATARCTWNGATGDLSLSVINNNVALPGSTAPDPSYTPQAFAAANAAVYQGILEDDSGNVVGAITGLTVKSTRAFTGKVVLNGVTYALSGSFLADGSFVGQILRPGKSALAVSLNLGVSGSGALVARGSVVGDGTTGSGQIVQAPYSKLHLAPAALARSYTFLIPATTTGNALLPGGEGYGSAKVSTLGVITVSGKTGDGVSFTHTGYLTVDSQWHLFQSLYAGRGQIAGVLTFRDVTSVSDVDGPLRWVKNPNPLQKSYAAGFNQAHSLVGAFYTPPVAGQRVLTQLAAQSFNARLTLAGTMLSNGGLAKALTWLGTNALVYYGPETLSSTMVASTGIMTGKYYDPVLKLTVPFAGAVLQKQGLAAGNFLLSNIAGYLLVEPGTGFPYPGSESGGPLAHLALTGSLATPPIVSPVTFNTAAAGSFGGILNNGPAITGGLDSVVITSTGALTGSLVIEGKRYAFKGGIGSDGKAIVTILRTGQPSLIGTLQLALANGTVDGFHLTGIFSGDGIDHVVDAHRFPVFTKLAPAPQMGKYTVSMPAPSNINVAKEPGGDGYASLTADYAGNNTGTLTLADGTTTTFSGRVSRSGEWSLVRTLYGSGYLAGKLTWRNVAGISDVDGQWHWVKPNSVPGTLTYPAGFNVARGVIGCLYAAPALAHRAFAILPDTNYNAWLRLSGPDMSTQAALTLTAVDRAITWNTANKVLYYGPDKATFVFTPTTGLVTGSYVDTPNGVSLTFGGALLQKQNLVTGRYSADRKSGLFSIAKR